MAIDDEAVLLGDVRFAQALGFGAKLCIHPRQVPIVRAAFAPGADAIAWATRVVAAAGAGRGAVQVDGTMVDRPVIDRAHAILDAAKPG
jgi:citrate lyase subunit beta/citryl-CoA lyase